MNVAGARYVCLSITKKIRSVSCPSAGTPSTQRASTYGCSSIPRARCAESLSGSSPRGSGSCSRCSAQPSGPSTACSLQTRTTATAWQTARGLRRYPITAASRHTTRCRTAVASQTRPQFASEKSRNREIGKWGPHRSGESPSPSEKLMLCFNIPIFVNMAL